MKIQLIILISFMVMAIIMPPVSGAYAAEALDTGSALQKLIGTAEKAEQYVLQVSNAYARPVLVIGVLAGAAIFLLGVLLSLLSKSFGEGVRNKALGIIGVAIISYILISNAPAIGNLVNSIMGGMVH